MSSILRAVRAAMLVAVGAGLPLVAAPANAHAQRVARVARLLFEEVMPGADRFADPAGDPPVVRAFRTDADGTETLHGYVFLTSDLPPEQFGYSGPIEALVGMRPNGTLTGMRVTDYRESYMQSMGDFLRRPGFQEQFADKHIGDPFQLWGDIEGISRVSISVRALSRGVRDASRRVANAYGLTEELAVGTEVVDPVGRSWFELRQLGVVQRFEVTEPGEGSAGIALAHITNERLGEYFLGAQLYERALQSAERRGGAENLVLYAIDGSRLRLFRQQGWSIVQEGDTTAIDPRNVVSLGLPSGGVVSGEATMVGLMLVDGSVDVSRPFTFVYDLNELGVHTVEYVTQEARVVRAEEAAAEEAQAADAAAALDAAAGAAAEEAETAEATEEAVAAGAAAGVGDTALRRPPGGVGTDGRDAVDSAAATERAAEAGVRADSSSAPGTVDDPIGTPDRAAGRPDAAQDGSLDFTVSEDESLFQRTLAGTSWIRVGIMLLVLALGAAAFFTKIVALRWTALAVTLVVLGFVDGGFLSVSHITSGIWAGMGVYLRDIPLLLIVTFTVVTTLVWGRVFCGFLCPFGALQDFIDRVVPRGLRRPLPQRVHDRAVWAKYGVLAIIVVPALLGSRVSTYEYFEPFGTVFFRSPSVLLWAIAGAFLAASVVVPRFYCRYACPLGAALGMLSFVSPRRIRRVEQCTVCKVCEQKCPTGAIRGPDIDFPECVRCNVCEVQLREKAGVCRHDMDDIRPRLVQLRVGNEGAAAGATHA
jgi:ferredoxin